MCADSSIDSRGPQSYLGRRFIVAHLSIGRVIHRCEGTNKYRRRLGKINYARQRILKTNLYGYAQCESASHPWAICHTLCTLHLPGVHPYSMHDNAWPHSVMPVHEHLLEVQLYTFWWPSYNADLNLIKHVWNKLERALRQLNRPLMTFGRPWSTYGTRSLRILKPYIHHETTVPPSLR